jgi:cell division protein ZapE
MTAAGLARADAPDGFAGAARHAAAAHGFSLDDAQQRALVPLERLYRELSNANRVRHPLLRLFVRRRPVRGLYLWGGVGRGKSFLMDTFFGAVPIACKRRVHFHRFMQEVHQRLRDLQGEQNPLSLVARSISADAQLLCLDEFQVTDIGDAMLMRNLLAGMFDSGAVLVTTSNLHPDQLYAHGLQRSQFLPAIALIRQHMDLVHLDGGHDYRLQLLEKEGVYHVPLDAGTEAAMAETFLHIAGTEGDHDQTLEIEGRSIRARRVAPGVGWFDFSALCDGPRGQADYIELARRMHTVLISNLRRFGPSDAEKRRRFTWLVDEFYDRRVKLILSAEDQLPVLFRDAGQGAEIDRTVSRLVEMQTRQYLGEAHLS